MCRSSSHYQNPHPRSRNTLMIKAFFVRFSSLKHHRRNSLPESLTLLFLPRINGAGLLIDGARVRPDTPAFVTLHRAVNVKAKAGEAMFGSRSRVSADGGIRFEVFTREDKILEGIFRKDGEEWRLECECGLESEEENSNGGAAAVAEVCVAVEGQGKGGEAAALSEKVNMASKKKKRIRKGKIDRLEVIPEENEEEEFESCCCCEFGDRGFDGGDSGEFCGPDCDMMMMDDMDLEGVRWAVDLGVWVMCFGVGYLVSKASARSLRRLRLF